MISLRMICQSLMCLAVSVAVSGHAQTVIKFSHYGPPTDPVHVGALKFKEVVEAKSGGKIKVNLFLGGALGSDQANVSALQGGTLEMVAMNSGILASQVKDFGVFDFPFMFADGKEADAVVDGSFGKKMHAKLLDKGIVGLGYYELGFRHMSNGRRPITKVADIEGLKLRVIPNPINVDWVKALGANPTPLPFPELYAALEQKAVDGQENPVATINSAKLYEVQKYVSETNHIWDPFFILGNRRSMTGLPTDLQELVRKEFDRAALEQREDTAKLNVTLKDQLIAKGLTFVASDKDSFRKALSKSGFYTEWRGKFGEENWKILESAVGTMA